MKGTLQCPKSRHVFLGSKKKKNPKHSRSSSLQHQTFTLHAKDPQYRGFATMETFNLAEELSQLGRYTNALITQANTSKKSSSSSTSAPAIAEDDQYFIPNETNLVQQFKSRASGLKTWLDNLALRLETQPTSLNREEVWNQLRSSLKFILSFLRYVKECWCRVHRYFGQLDSGARSKIASLIKTGLRLQTDALHEALENRQREVYNEYRQALDRYTLLNDWLFTLSEKVLQPKSKTSTDKETSMRSIPSCMM